ncbi:MAG: D-inositol-3-phosphate glycosyltransferase [Gammaproteobacteria bacterium]|nr:D-inositol-3-phosphate glycosyltransferase [Gammaproteobacteria bacterium]
MKSLHYKFPPRTGVLFVGPDADARGGIATVLATYKRTAFWNQFNCMHFPTCIEHESRVMRLIYAIRQMCAFLVLMLRTKPAIVGIHTASMMSFYRKCWYMGMVRLCGRRYVLHVHPAFFLKFYEQGGILRKWLVRRAFRGSQKVLFLSTPSMREFAQVTPDVEMDVISNPVDVGSYPTAKQPHISGTVQVLFLGWIVKEKGVYDILDAIPEVIKRVPEARFVFAGNKEVAKLREAIKQRGLAEHASVLGWVCDDRKRELLLGSRVLLLPSYTEGVPNVILEAMAAGLPVITTPVGGIPEIFTEGVNGYFVRPGQPSDIAIRTVALLRDDSEFARISALTRQAAVERFDVSVIGVQLERIYRPFVDV